MRQAVVVSYARTGLAKAARGGFNNTSNMTILGAAIEHAVKRAKVQATNYRQCLALDVPGYVAFYQSRPGFSGSDRVTLEIKHPDGRIEIQKITVTVAESDRSI